MWRISTLATGRAYDIATDAHADIWFDLGNAARVLGNTDFCKWMEFKVIPT
jgi:hypothetical protein